MRALRRKKTDLNVFIKRVTSLNEELTFNQLFFMLTGRMPEGLLDSIEALNELKTKKTINNESFNSLVHLYESNNLVNTVSPGREL